MGQDQNCGNCDHWKQESAADRKAERGLCRFRREKTYAWEWCLAEWKRAAQPQKDGA